MRSDYPRRKRLFTDCNYSINNNFIFSSSRIVSDRKIFSALCDFIALSEQEICLTSFEIFLINWHSNKLANIFLSLLISTLKRNIPIKILLNQKFPNPFQKSSNTKSFLILKNAGINVRQSAPNKILHTKFVISPPDKIFFSTANLTNSAWLYNNELALILKSDDLYMELKNYFDILWNSAT